MEVLLAWNGPANAAERTIRARREIPLLRHLAAQGVHPTVLLFGDDGGLRDDLVIAKIDVHVLPASLRCPRSRWDSRRRAATAVSSFTAGTTTAGGPGC